VVGCKYWGNSYGYDAWGNLLQKTTTKCGAENMAATADARNWLHSPTGADYQYDAAGNMTYDASGQYYSYDQENRITGAGAYTYTYDADGNRVKKSNGSTGTLYWYMSPGIVAESDLNGTLQSEYVFFDGDRVARKDFPGNAVAYYFSDHLKTANIITDAQGNITKESDFYPWGGELQFVNNDKNDYLFGGHKRDIETGLDYFGARYYSNGLGRFITPDWSATPVPVPYADLSDPQSLNLYAYVRNVPTLRFDADGHDGWETFKTLVKLSWQMQQLIFEHDRARIAHYMETHTPPHFGTGGLPRPQYPPGTPCWCNPSAGTTSDSNKQDNNNSYRSNTQEQGRDAQGKFVSKKPGEASPGSGAEKKALDAVGATKNTQKLNGTIRDGTVTETGQHVEVKSGASVNDTQQLRSMGQTARDATGKPLKVVTTNPDVKVSKPAQENKNLEFHKLGNQ
jgi:RHS repeat-associated protein